MLQFLLVISAAVIAGSVSAADRNGGLNRYLIYTRTNYNNSIELDLNVDTTVTALNLEKNTVVIIHGHQGSGNTSLNPTVKNAFLTSEDIDVIIVDWSLYAAQSSNVLVAVPSIAKGLANVINELVTKRVVTLETLHLVGFDLGAHIAGYVGRSLGGKVARITGLNPTREQGGASFQRLRITDALYVEVLHTDGIGLLAYGIGDAIGHVDFFVNGGTNQPECQRNNNWCSHNRSWKVFADTLYNSHLVGHQCHTWFQVYLNTCHGFTLKLGGNDLVKYGFGMFRVNTRKSIRTRNYISKTE